MRMVRATVLAALLLAACGGSDDTTTTADGEGGATTTAAAATTSTVTDGEGDGGGGIAIGDVPQECLDIFADMLRAMEPVVQGVDFDNATTADLEALGEEMDTSMAGYEQALTESGCEELDVDASTEDQFDFMIAFAQDEAPGTVAWLAWIRDFAVGFEEGGAGGGEATGDCETDITALMVYVGRDGGMGDLTLAELTAVGQLMTSLATACSAPRYEEFLSDPAVTEFLESS